MRFYQHIQFNSLPVQEICEFFVERLHVDLQHLLSIIQVSLSMHGVDFERWDPNQLYVALFTKVKDRCEQLIRLESKIIFPMYQKQLSNNKILTINLSSLQYMDEILETIQIDLDSIVRVLNQAKTSTHLSSRETMVLNDLTQLHALVDDWSKIKNQYLSVAIIA